MDRCSTVEGVLYVRSVNTAWFLALCFVSVYLYVNVVFFQFKFSHQPFTNAIMTLQSFALKRTMFLFRSSVASNSWRPHGLQHVRLPSFTVSWNLLKLCPLSRWILQARILEWVALPFSRGSSWPRDPTRVSYIASRFFTVWDSETFTENDIMILCCSVSHLPEIFTTSS